MAEAIINQLLDPAIVLAEGGLKAGEIAADFGCGMVGHFIFPAATIVGHNGRVLAIDIQKTVLDSVRSRAQLMHCNNVQMLWGDIERPQGVRVMDQTCDLALLINNLWSAKNTAALVEELRRTTKVGGRVVLVDWQTIPTPMGPPSEQRVTPATAERLFTQYGFLLDHPFTPGPYHWGLVFKRAS